MTTQAEWTVLVFLNAKNNLEQYAFDNFAQMAKVGSTNEVNIVVEFGRPKQHYFKGFEDWSKTLRFRVEKGQTPIPKNALEDCGQTDMGDPASLATFVEWGMKKYPAKHTMLVIWDHGQGWRAPLDAPDMPKPAEHPAVSGGFRYVSNDDDTGNKMFNRGIQDALQKLLGGKKLDIIAFDACLMSMLESHYAFRKIARIMVASEELEPGDGWQYEYWLKPLVDVKGAMTAEMLAPTVIAAMDKRYGEDADTTLSAVLLEMIESLSTAVSTFSTAATAVMTKDTIAAFKTARNGCKNYAPGYGLHSIDLQQFMEQIGKSTVDASVKTAATDVIAKIQQVVMKRHAGKPRQGAFGSHGVSIYFPNNRAAHKADPDGKGYDEGNKHFPVEFVEKEQWATFLRSYWELVP